MKISSNIASSRYSGLENVENWQNPKIWTLNTHASTLVYAIATKILLIPMHSGVVVLSSTRSRLLTRDPINPHAIAIHQLHKLRECRPLHATTKPKLSYPTLLLCDRDLCHVVAIHTAGIRKPAIRLSSK